MNEERGVSETPAIGGRAERALSLMVESVADRCGGLEGPSGPTPIDVLRDALRGLDAAAQIDVLTLVAGRAVLGLVAGAVVAAERSGDSIAAHLHGIGDNEVSDTAKSSMEVRPKGFDNERCAGVLTVGKDLRGACDERPIVAHRGVHHCFRCFRLVSGSSTTYDTDEWQARLRRHGIL